jgi:hypothetical protein
MFSPYFDYKKKARGHCCMAGCRDHNLGSFLRSQHGDCHFLLAEELDSKRLFIAFRDRGSTKELFAFLLLG